MAQYLRKKYRHQCFLSKSGSGLNIKALMCVFEESFSESLTWFAISKIFKVQCYIFLSLCDPGHYFSNQYSAIIVCTKTVFGSHLFLKLQAIRDSARVRGKEPGCPYFKEMKSFLSLPAASISSLTNSGEDGKQRARGEV